MAPSHKTMLFVCLLVAAVAVVVPVAQGTIFGSIFPPLFSLYRITGTLFCSINGANATVVIGNGTVNATTTPPFANAAVQLRCTGVVIASTTTDASGGFTILFQNPITAISTLLNNCRVVVATPLAACNATLPATGNLVSTLGTGTRSIVNGLSVVQFNITTYTLINIGI